MIWSSSDASSENPNMAAICWPSQGRGSRPETPSPVRTPGGLQSDLFCGTTIAFNNKRASIVKAVILAGGLGTRISEETTLKPKPMVEIGGRPILWHIMKLYSAHGVNDFVVCLGYKAEVVKDFFLNYHVRQADLTVHVAEDRVEVHDAAAVEPWR